MKKASTLFLATGCCVLCLLAIAPGCGGTGSARQEKETGWSMLFDGKSLAGWRGIGQAGAPAAHWTVEDGALHKRASGTVPTAPDGQPLKGGDLMTDETFGDFELEFEWRISPGGNSGVKYNVSEEMSMNNPIAAGAALGFEYQVLDDDRHEDAHKGNGTNRTAASLYDLIGRDQSVRPRAVGEWNTARIVFRNGHGEHWLNGSKVLEYDLGTPRFDSLLAASKYAAIPHFADVRRGHIVLQDHGDDAWYRNIRIRTFN